MTAELHTALRLHHERVHRFSLRVCRDEADADDAVQEAFIKLSRRPDVLRHEGALSWLMTVVRRACLRLLRSWGRQQVEPLEPSEPGPAAKSAAPRVSEAARTVDFRQRVASEGGRHELSDLPFERWERVRAVQAALAALPPIYREVLVLRELEGLSGEETSEILGIELAAMKSRLHRARALLRAELLHTE